MADTDIVIIVNPLPPQAEAPAGDSRATISDFQNPEIAKLDRAREILQADAATLGKFLKWPNDRVCCPIRVLALCAPLPQVHFVDFLSIDRHKNLLPLNQDRAGMPLARSGGDFFTGSLDAVE